MAASSLSHSALFIRDLDGDFSNGHEGAYDDILDITWVLDTGIHRRNIEETNWEPDHISYPWRVTDGEHIHNRIDTLNWLSQFSYAGINTWRLPKLNPVNGTSYLNVYSNGFQNMNVDVGYGIVSPNSELSHLINVTLGNLGDRLENGSYRPTSNPYNEGPFIDLFGNSFWVESGSCGSNSFWVDSFGHQQTTAGCTLQDEGFPTATLLVTDGDVGIAVVPLPAGIWLFFSSLSIILCIKQCKAQRLKNKRGV